MFGTVIGHVSCLMFQYAGWWDVRIGRAEAGEGQDDGLMEEGISQ